MIQLRSRNAALLALALSTLLLACSSSGDATSQGTPGGTGGSTSVTTSSGSGGGGDAGHGGGGGSDGGGAMCGDGTCDETETCTSCPDDCGACPPACTRSFYVSSHSGDDNHTSADAQERGTPWRSLDKVNGIFGSLQPGDCILLERGDVFSGSVSVGASGSAGSPITVGAYGTGAKPIITGFIGVTAWTDLGNHVWESTESVSSLPTLNVVTVGGTDTPMGRYPRSDYLVYTSSSGTSSITSSQLANDVDWTGAEVVIRTSKWGLQRDLVTHQVGGELSYTGQAPSPPTNGYGFFLQNDPKTLTYENAWHYAASTGKLRIYSANEPSGVSVSVIERLASNDGGYDHVTFDDIDFEGANSYALQSANGEDITIQNCRLALSGQSAIYVSRKVSTSGDITVDRNVFANNHDSAVNAQSTVMWVKNNTIDDTGMIPGAAIYDPASGSENFYDAIITTASGSIIEHNVIQNVGHSGIRVSYADAVIIRNNYITNFGMTRYDAGGIYSWNSDPTLTSRVIDHNVVVGSNPVSAGIGTGTGWSLFGIYLDGNSNRAAVTGNTVAHCHDAGIYNLNSGSVTIRHNTCFDNGSQLGLTHAFDGGSPIMGMSIDDNVFVAKTHAQTTLYFRDDTNPFAAFGTADGNVYARPIADGKSIANVVKYSEKDLSLAEWQSLTGQDAHSTKSPVAIPNVDDLRFAFNASSVEVMVPLQGTYVDMEGTSHSGAIALAPFSSVVLIKH